MSVVSLAPFNQAEDFRLRQAFMKINGSLQAIGALDVFSVAEYGAVGDGVTDDYPAITRTLQALAEKGEGTLFFPANRVYRIGTPGAHGLHLDQLSNVTVEFGFNTTLLMDNMESSLAVSHGIYVQGPCENITILNAHVKYAEMPVSRQTWAPFYLLGANVGTGDISGTGWYRGEVGGERPDLIEAGAVKNVIMRDCFSENSPSVFCGIVGVDGIEITRFHGYQSWADGLYHRFFRKSRVNNVLLEKAHDDAISLGSEESNLALADIDNDFHGEGSYISGVVVRGTYPETSYTVPSGSIVLLGSRDIVISDVTVEDKYRCVRVETGTETSGPYVNLNLNYLANKNINLSNITAERVGQSFVVINKEVTLDDDAKWWRNSVRVSNYTHRQGEIPFTVFATSSIPPIMCGYYFDGFYATEFSSPFATLTGVLECRFDRMKLDGNLTISGFVPFEGDPDDPSYPNNYCEFDGIEAKTLVLLGLKRCTVGRLMSFEAPETGITISSSSDINFLGLEAVNANRTGYAFGNGAIIDAFCKRITGEYVYVQHDDSTPMPDAFSINNAENHRVRRVRVVTNLATAYRMVSDAAFNTTKISQIERIDWYHGGETPTPQWRTKLFPTGGATEIGDSDFTMYPDDPNHGVVLISYPLTANHIIKASHDSVAIGQRFIVKRETNATGAYTVEIQGDNGGTTYTIHTMPAGECGSAELIFTGTTYKLLRYSSL